ncbi:MAG: zf-HC2 domain-containing protein [Thermoanaerobaculales bacterium]|nr:zf-HC2 domain-containing protein [Thermoanaerobaculales bacterium]
MSRCQSVRDLFSDSLEGALTPEEAKRVQDHLAECDECRGLYEEMSNILGAAEDFAHIEPPSSLEAEISSSPCRRWLGLLYSAVDREISDVNLDRLFQHLEGCEGCRRAWSDLTLIHQAGQALEPPAHLLSRCLRPQRRLSGQRILGRRTATAAAYMLAILASFVLGNPVTQARYDATQAVQRVSAAFDSEVAGVANTGRGEARMMLWRAVSFGRRAAETVRTTWSELTDDPVPGDPSEDHKETPS